ncbi:hypothetical protein B0T17DRAFT_658643 [Bombardia bombarda]|uniref:Uncharacterized protein n=1 Tax=Bombardia bombarda TaxID=252184 RepID=A0AA39TM36_9PEZI|nr:hypothetical protein B0T17DRAFT_658643 [Bombardia bombarda]
MKFSLPSKALLAVAATMVAATPTPHMGVNNVESRGVEDLQGWVITNSGCNYITLSVCGKMKALCQCPNGWIYELNGANMDAGKHGCDPPWQFYAKNQAGLSC